MRIGQVEIPMAKIVITLAGALALFCAVNRTLPWRVLVDPIQVKLVNVVMVDGKLEAGEGSLFFEKAKAPAEEPSELKRGLIGIGLFAVVIFIVFVLPGLIYTLGKKTVNFIFGICLAFLFMLFLTEITGIRIMWADFAVRNHEFLAALVLIARLVVGLIMFCLKTAVAIIVIMGPPIFLLYLFSAKVFKNEKGGFTWLSFFNSIAVMVFCGSMLYGLFQRYGILACVLFLAAYIYCNAINKRLSERGIDIERRWAFIGIILPALLVGWMYFKDVILV